MFRCSRKTAAGCVDDACNWAWNGTRGNSDKTSWVAAETMMNGDHRIAPGPHTTTTKGLLCKSATGTDTEQFACNVFKAYSSAAQRNVKPRLHEDNMLSGNMLPSTCCLLPSTKLLSVCCPSDAGYKGITSRPWLKWIVIMLPRYSQHVARTSNLLSGNMLLAWQHVALVKRGFTRTVSTYSELIN